MKKNAKKPANRALIPLIPGVGGLGGLGPGPLGPLGPLGPMGPVGPLGPGGLGPGGPGQQGQPYAPGCVNRWALVRTTNNQSFYMWIERSEPFGFTSGWVHPNMTYQRFPSNTIVSVQCS